MGATVLRPMSWMKGMVVLHLPVVRAWGEVQAATGHVGPAAGGEQSAQGMRPQGMRLEGGDPVSSSLSARRRRRQH